MITLGLLAGAVGSVSAIGLIGFLLLATLGVMVYMLGNRGPIARDRRELEALRRGRYMKCPLCGYDLRALEPRGRCPECGAAYTPDVLTSTWERTYGQR